MAGVLRQWDGAAWVDVLTEQTGGGGSCSTSLVENPPGSGLYDLVPSNAMTENPLGSGLYDFGG